MKIIKLLTFLLVLSIPFGELLRFDLGNNITVKPLDVLAIVTSCSWLFYYFLIKKSSYNIFLHWKLLLFPLTGLVSLLLNSFWLTGNELFTAFLYLLRWAAYGVICIIITKTNYTFKKKLIYGVYIDGIIILFLGILQYFLYPNLKNLYYLGWDEHIYRLFSTFLDPNFAGAFFVLYFFFSTGLFLALYKKKKYKINIIIGSILLLTVAAIFLTYSRSAIIMLIAGSATYLTLIRRKKLLLIIVGIIFLILMALTPTFTTESTNLLRVTSGEARLSAAGNAIRVIKDHWVLGVGFDAYKYAQISYGFVKINPRYPSHADAGTDNSFLFVLATTGIIGLATYLYLWFYILKREYTLFNGKTNILAGVVIVSIVGLFVDSLFINSLFYPTFMLWLWTFVGITESRLL